MAKSKTINNLHAKMYIQAVYEARLREEGFLCPDEKLLCWYRVKENEVYDSVIFRTTWPRIPIMIDILYETSPLFFAPFRTPSVNFFDRTDMRLDCRMSAGNLERGPINAANLAQFSKDIGVYAPAHGGRGIYTFDAVVLPELNQMRTVEECYLQHKNYHIKLHAISESNSPGRSRWFGSASLEFIAEAVYLDDSEIYPYLRDCVEQGVEQYRKLAFWNPNKKDTLRMLQEWELLKTALFDDGREEFLNAIEERKEQTRKQFTKWGIT